MIKAASLFSQILSTIRTAANFDNLVAKHEAEKNAKGFESKTQLVSMLFCHLAKADSLREIVNGLACCNGMMSHIGLKKAPSRSSLSYAISRRPTRRFPESSRSLRLFINAHRPPALFEEFFWTLNNHIRSTTGRGPRKAK